MRNRMWQSFPEEVLWIGSKESEARKAFRPHRLGCGARAHVRAGKGLTDQERAVRQQVTLALGAAVGGVDWVETDGLRSLRCKLGKPVARPSRTERWQH